MNITVKTCGIGQFFCLNVKLLRTVWHFGRFGSQLQPRQVQFSIFHKWKCCYKLACQVGGFLLNSNAFLQCKTMQTLKQKLGVEISIYWSVSIWLFQAIINEVHPVLYMAVHHRLIFIEKASLVRSL